MRSKFGSMLLAGALMLAITTIPSAAAQESSPSAPRATSAAPSSGSLEIAVTYDGTLTALINASRFWMQGGSVQVEGRFYRGWAAVAEISGMHIGNINSTGVGLDLVTATFGPRYTWSPKHARWSAFAEALTGEAFGMNSVFPNPQAASSTSTSLAVKAGGGLNVGLSKHLALRAIEANYLRTQFSNTANNRQNNLTLGAGVVLRF